MLGPPTAHHIDEVGNYLARAKHSTVHPASPLLHQHHHGLGRVCKSLSVRYICQLVLIQLFDVDLETHDSVLSQILIGLGTRGHIRPRLIPEEHLERLSLDGLPPEERVGTGEHLSEAKERFARFVGGMAELVLIELGGLEEPRSKASIIWSLKIDLDLTAASTAVFVGLHVRVELHESIIVHLSSNIEHEAELWLEVLADPLKEPFM